MSAEESRDRLAGVLTAPLAEVGLDVEAVELTPAGKRRLLRVAVDKDGGVTMDDIADATREVSRVLDDTNVMGEQPYTLEVTSPGRGPAADPAPPLAAQQHRLVKVTLTGGTSVTGRIVGSDEPARTSTSRAPRTRCRTTTSPRPRSRSSSTGRSLSVPMDIDMSILRSLEREKEISFDVLVEAIEQALLTAYHKTPGAQPARASSSTARPGT